MILRRNKSDFSRSFLAKFARHKLAVVGAVIILTILILCFFAPIFTQHTANDINLQARSLKPGEGGYLLGTDRIGRDVWARVLYGGRVSISIGLVSALGAAIIGVTLGSFSGYIGGRFDKIMLRFSEVFNMFPQTMLVLIVLAVAGAGIVNLCLVFILTGWMPVFRLVRGRFFSLREEPFVESLRAMSIPRRSIIFKHILPLTLGPVLVNFTIISATFILTETGLSFLGLGVPSGTPTWGNIINAARDLEVLTKMPWLWATPGVAICLYVLGMNFLGDGLRDLIDPRQ